jgi:hypothetical protein
MTAGFLLTTPLNAPAAGFCIIGESPGIGRPAECVETIYIGTGLRLSSSKDQRIQKRFFRAGILPEADFVALDFGEVGLSKSLV